jgi:hypothetical protein
MQSRDLITTLLIVLLGATCVAAEECHDRDLRGVAVKKIDLFGKGFDQAPSKELLEFLMEWETPSGEWIGPQEIENMNILESKNETTEK